MEQHNAALQALVLKGKGLMSELHEVAYPSPVAAGIPPLHAYRAMVPALLPLYECMLTRWLSAHRSNMGNAAPTRMQYCCMLLVGHVMALTGKTARLDKPCRRRISCKVMLAYCSTGLAPLHCSVMHRLYDFAEEVPRTGGNLELVGTVGALEGLMDEVNILLDDHSEMWRQYQGLPMNRRHSHSYHDGE